MTRPWQTLARVDTDEGVLELRLRGEREFLITVAGRVLMTSAAHRSEVALAARACRALAGRASHKPSPSEPKTPNGGGGSPRILLGGLGMGFTLRAALDRLPPGARVVVAELTAAVVDWCKGPMAMLAGDALADPRVEVRVADVARVIAAKPAAWDAIVLDLYEGPNSATQRGTNPFYGRDALAYARAALRPGGVMAIWAEDPDGPFERRFAAAGFQVTVHREGKGGGGRRHIIYVGTVAPAASPASPPSPRRA